jgi:2-polyprenyl-3-methyl-5-hydroxy-6-metoxy-1,4-benzoquinol methylase
MTRAPSAQCKICASEATFLCDTKITLGTTTELNHFRCRECGLVFVGNEFSDADLGEAYGSLDWDDYYRDIFGENQRKIDRSVVDLQQLIADDARIIDVGAGNGQFMATMLSQGFTNVSGHEIPGATLAAVEGQECRTYFDFDYRSIPSNTFDAATLLDVAEHVPDPRHLFESCHRVLRNGGAVYFHTPVVARMDKLMHRTLKVPGLKNVGRMWQAGRTSVLHLQNYTADSLKALLHAVGFSEISITIKNELSWPVKMYVRKYFSRKLGLPDACASICTPLFYAFIATNVLNANKAIVVAWKRDHTAASAVPQCGSAVTAPAA